MFFDLETTSLNTVMGDVIEIAIVNNDIKFHEYIKPIRWKDDMGTSIHGITPEKMKGFSESWVIADKLLSFFEIHRPTELWYHGLFGFDVVFLENFFRWVWLENINVRDRFFRLWQEIEKHSTLPLVRGLKLQNNKLNTAMDYFNQKFKHHSALDDARAVEFLHRKLWRSNERQSSNNFGQAWC